MKRIDLRNPFNAPVYHEETLSSTMDAARTLADTPHGTVIMADFQERGRGRSGRFWNTEKGQNLLFTVILNFPGLYAIPKAITLRTGLAAALAIEDFIPELKGHTAIKWPNDIMLSEKKAAGILTESDGSRVYTGIGINLLQEEFPDGLNKKAASLIGFCKEKFPDSGSLLRLTEGDCRFLLLQKILDFLFEELNNAPDSWTVKLLERLYKRGQIVTFAEGASDSHNIITGRLEGITGSGELLLLPDGESSPRAFINGELRVY